MNLAVEERPTSLSSLRTLDVTDASSATILRTNPDTETTQRNRFRGGVMQRTEAENKSKNEKQPHSRDKSRGYVNYLEVRRAKRREREAKKQRSKNGNNQNENANTKKDEASESEVVNDLQKPENNDASDNEPNEEQSDARLASPADDTDEGIQSTTSIDEHVNEIYSVEQIENELINESDTVNKEDEIDSDEGRGSITEFGGTIAELPEALNKEKPLMVHGLEEQTNFKIELTDDLAADLGDSGSGSLFGGFRFGSSVAEEKVELDDNSNLDETYNIIHANDSNEENTGNSNVQSELDGNQQDENNITLQNSINNNTESVENDQKTDNDTSKADIENIDIRDSGSDLKVVPAGEGETKEAEGESETRNEEVTFSTEEGSEATIVSSNINSENKVETMHPKGVRSYFKNKNLSSRKPKSRRQSVDPVSQRKQNNKPQMKSSLGRNRRHRQIEKPVVEKADVQETGNVSAPKASDEIDLTLNLNDINEDAERIDSYRSSEHQATNRDQSHPIQKRVEDFLSESQAELHMRRPKGPRKRVQLPEEDPPDGETAETNNAADEGVTEVWVPEEDKVYVYKYSSEPRVLQMKNGGGRRVASLGRWDNDPNSSFRLKLR